MQTPCIRVMCESSIDEMLANPNDFAWDQDVVLVSISLGSGDINPTYIMMGKDEEENDFYFVVEDDETSEYFYLEEGETLKGKYEELVQTEYNRLYRGRNYDLIEEMKKYLLEESQMANMDLVFVNHESGEQTVVTDSKVLGVMNSILEEAYLPFITTKLINRLDERGMLYK